MKYFLTVLSVVILFTISSCDEPNYKSTITIESEFDLNGIIQEAIQTSNYTYCLVKEGSSEYWIAFTKMQVEEGQQIYFNQGLEMKDFPSKELDRVFETVFFIQEISTNPSKDSTDGHHLKQQGQKSEVNTADINVEKAKGGISIAELYANKKNYEGKRVKIRGKVTKCTDLIMDRYFIHIQDGTESNGKFDLTITSMETVNVGGIVTFEGKITLNKDFGSGYSYEVIMEEAKVLK